MKTVNLGEAKAHRSRLVREVPEGAEPEIIIALDGSPAVRIVPYGPTPRRVLGLDSGIVHVPADFFASNEEIANLFNVSS